MITPDQFLSILKTRELGVFPVKLQNQTQWRVVTSTGSRATGRNELFFSPEEGVEAADLHLRLVESKESGAIVSQVILALSRGDFFIKSEDVADPNNQGEKIKVFSGFKSNGQPSPTVKNRPTFISAVLDMEKEVLNERSTRRNTV